MPATCIFSAFSSLAVRPFRPPALYEPPSTPISG